MSRPILFIDFDKTICFDRFWQHIPERDFQIIQKFLFQENRDKVKEWMHGKMSAEEICTFVDGSHNIEVDLLQELERGCREMHINPKILDYIQALRPTYHLVLMTSNADTFTRWTVPSLELKKYFDQIINSADTNEYKTDNQGAPYKREIDRHGSRVEECINLDDSTDAIQVFRDLGGVAYQVSKEKPVEAILEGILEGQHNCHEVH